MKNIFLVVIVALLGSCSVTATELNIFHENGRYGYFNADRKIVIPAKFEMVTEFNMGKAVVKVSKNHFAVIDDKGTSLFKFQSEFTYPRRIKDNLILYKKDGKYGFYDLDGETVLFGYEIAFSFSEGLAVIWDQGNFSYLNNKGEPLTLESKKLVFDDANSFHEGLARVGIERNGKMLYGFINKKGEYVIEPKFEYLEEYFSNGLCGAALKWSGNTDAPILGYINKSGEWQIPPIYYEVRGFSGKVAPVRYKKSKWFMSPSEFWKLVDKSGKDICILDDAVIISGNYKNGLIWYGENIGGSLRYGFLDETGKPIIGAVLEETFSTFRNGYCAVNYEGKDAILLRSGELILNKDFFRK